MIDPNIIFPEDIEDDNPIEDYWDDWYDVGE